MATQYNNSNAALEGISYGTSLNFGSYSAPATFNSLSLTQYFSATQAVLGTVSNIHAAVADNGAAQVISTGFTQALSARNLVITPSGTAGNVTAMTIVATGMDAVGQPMSESFLLSAGALTPVVGNKAFKSVTSINQPAIGAGVSVSYGSGSKLGFSSYMYGNTVFYAFLGGVKEASAPVVTTSLVNLSLNTFSLVSALSGAAVYIAYQAAFDQSAVG